MARRNVAAKGAPLDKWALKDGQMFACALHRLPLETFKAKRRVRDKGEVKLVDAEVARCPAGCCDPHVVDLAGAAQDVPGLICWRRPLDVDTAKADLAEYKKDPKAYIAKVAPEKKPQVLAAKVTKVAPAKSDKE